MTNTKFTQEHTWVRLENDGVVTFGITDYAQDEIGDIVFIEMPLRGSMIKSGEKSAVIESVKSAIDIPVPISGEVIEINDVVANDPAIINSDPEQQGWLFKIKPSNLKELDDLMDSQAYEKYLAK